MEYRNAELWSTKKKQEKLGITKNDEWGHGKFSIKLSADNVIGKKETKGTNPITSVSEHRSQAPKSGTISRG